MRYKSQWGSRQCRGDLFVFKDVFSAQFLNCRRIVKPNADHRKIHLEISVSLSVSDSLSLLLWILCAGSKVYVCGCKSYVFCSYLCLRLYFYTWIETISVLNVNNGIWKIDTKSAAAPGRRSASSSTATENNPDERENLRRGEAHSTRESGRESETNSNTNESNDNNNSSKPYQWQKQQQQFRAFPKSNMAELNFCALLFVRSFAVTICGHCCHDNRLHTLASGDGARDRDVNEPARPETRDQRVACS